MKTKTVRRQVFHREMNNSLCDRNVTCSGNKVTGQRSEARYGLGKPVPARAGVQKCEFGLGVGQLADPFEGFGSGGASGVMERTLADWV